jgi:DNA-binding CsgD family transcriptional regulator
MGTHRVIEKVSSHYGCSPQELANKRNTKENVMSCRARIVKTLLLSGFTNKEIAEILNIDEGEVLVYGVPAKLKPPNLKDPRILHAAKLLKSGMDVVSAGFCAGYTKRKDGRGYRLGRACNILVDIVDESGGVDAFVAKHIH